MGQCQLCKKEVDMPFTCSYCGQQFCAEHRLPENHRCPNLPKRGWENRSTSKAYSSTPKYMRRKSRTKTSPSRERSVNSKIVIILILIGITGFFYLQYRPSLDDIKTIIGDAVKEIQEGYQELTEAAIKILQEVKQATQPAPLNHFESLDELILFLEQDNVSDILYASDFKCGDFSEALANRAKKAGYYIEVYSMWDSELEDFIQYVETLEYTTTEGRTTITTTFTYGEGRGHAVCRVTINTKQYLIEPQSDMIYEILDPGYKMKYYGEVTQ